VNQRGAEAIARRILTGSAGLGLGQLFVLIFGFLLASSLIFLFGIWVGRDITERRLAREERVVRAAIPAQPMPAETPKAAEGDAAFYERLREKAIQRLQETVAAAPRSPAAARAVAVATSVRPTIRVAEKPAPRPTLPPQPPAPPRRVDEWADKGWTVQVNATTNPEQATDLARNLRAKGYDAYTLQAPMRGQTWYRVRVGRLPTREKAKELETKLKSTEGLDNAYVTPQ
jgi:cell division septation protein DedD